MRFLKRVFLAVIGLTALMVPRAQAQDQGLAVISTPLGGATVSGTVLILGTATHPQFQRYELAFGYSPNPTNTWFSIQDPAQTQVVNDILGRWDTTGIADGTYILRLRVYWSDRAFTEALVQGVRVQNATPAAPAARAAPPASATPVKAASATPAIVLPPTSTPRPTTAVVSANTTNQTTGAPPSWLDTQTIRRAIGDGAKLTGMVFAILALYAGLKAALRYKPKR